MKPATGFRLKAIRHYQPPERSFPWEWKRSTNPLKVVIRQATFEKIQHHAAGDLNNERFGILVGNAFTDPKSQTKWVEVTDMFPPQRVEASRAYVEVSAEELIRLDRQLDQSLAQNVRKVGWYHTHIDHRIFMSDTDRDNQKRCYNADWQIALVYDPIKKEWGIFSGADCLEVDDRRIVSDEQAKAAWEAWENSETLSLPLKPNAPSKQKSQLDSVAPP